MNEMNIALRVSHKEKALFLRKSIIMGPFISQKTVSMKFFTDCCARNFFLGLGVSVFLCSECFFTVVSLMYCKELFELAQDLHENNQIYNQKHASINRCTLE